MNDKLIRALANVLRTTQTELEDARKEYTLLPTAIEREDARLRKCINFLRQATIELRELQYERENRK